MRKVAGYSFPVPMIWGAHIRKEDELFSSRRNYEVKYH